MWGGEEKGGRKRRGEDEKGGEEEMGKQNLHNGCLLRRKTETNNGKTWQHF